MHITMMPSRLKSRLLLAATACLLIGIAIEGVCRFRTHNAQNGLPQIMRVVLLPYRVAPVDKLAPADPSDDAGYIGFDSELGWTIRPNTSTPGVTSNPQGARGGPVEGYSREVPVGFTRVLTFGDSFTHCDEVADHETWQRHMQRIRQDLEVVNFGVPGYGTDQAFLRWRKVSRQLEANISLLCIWPEDICRNLNINRMFMVPFEYPAAKPRFLLVDGDLELIGQPCMSFAESLAATAELEAVPLFRHDAWMRADEVKWRFCYNVRALRFALSIEAAFARRAERMAMYTGVDPRANDITVAICKQFAKEARELGTRPVVVVIPMRDLLERFPGGLKSLPLVRSIAESKIEVWDLSRAFSESSNLDALNPRRSHMTSLGNELIAHEIVSRLQQAGDR
jgi:hypothetical protein